MNEILLVIKLLTELIKENNHDLFQDRIENTMIFASKLTVFQLSDG